MKKIALAVGLLAGATAGYSQGVLNWSDFDAANSTPPTPAFSITIFGVGTETPGTGPYPNNTSADLPAGTATYTGSPLSGAGFTIGLYVDTSATLLAADVATGTPVATSTFGTGGNAGTWDLSGSLNATVPGIASGTSVFVELAAWQGSFGSYANALAAAVPTGTSGVSSGEATLGGGGSPPATPGTLAGIGLQDFQLSGVPEPSTIALGVIGASTFLMRLRRKQ
jgi:hypothetical protein